MGIGTSLETAVNTLLTNYVTSKSAAVSAAIAPVALTGVTVYVLLMGYAIMRGEAHDSLHTFLWRSAKIAFIAGLALTAGEFQSSVIGLVEGVQGALTQALSGAPSLGALIDNVEAPYIALETALFDAAMPTSFPYLPNISIVFAAVLVAIAQFVLFIIAFGMYLLAKVGLTLVFAVGPVFILCAMFPATQRFAESWLGQALNFALLNVLIAASIGMLTQFASDFAGQMVGRVDSVGILRDVGALLMATLAMGVVMLNLDRLASALAGGVALQGIGRDIGRKLSEMLSPSRQPRSKQPPSGGRIDGSGNAKGTPAPPGGNSSASAGGTIDAYQQRVQEQIRSSSTQGSQS